MICLRKKYVHISDGLTYFENQLIVLMVIDFEWDFMTNAIAYSIQFPFNIICIKVFIKFKI